MGLTEASKRTMTRIESFDVARSLCMLWIVGVWHMCSGYLNIPISNSVICKNITTGVLTTFFFMSGALSNSYGLKKTEIISWLTHKVSKLYPLYLISAITLLIFGYYKSVAQLISTVLCIGWGFQPMVGTIWFVQVLILYYFLTPLIICNEKMCSRINIKIVVLILFYIMLILEHKMISCIDERVLIFIPAYTLGIYHRVIIDNISKNNSIARPKYIVISLCALLFGAISVVIGKENATWASDTLCGILFAYALYGISRSISKIESLRVVFATISFSSTFAYLFHRQVYGTLRAFVSFTPFLGYVVALPLLLVFSYIGQRIYNQIAKTSFQWGKSKKIENT